MVVERQQLGQTTGHENGPQGAKARAVGQEPTHEKNERFMARQAEVVRRVCVSIWWGHGI